MQISDEEVTNTVSPVLKMAPSSAQRTQFLKTWFPGENLRKLGFLPRMPQYVVFLSTGGLMAVVSSQVYVTGSMNRQCWYHQFHVFIFQVISLDVTVDAQKQIISELEVLYRVSK